MKNQPTLHNEELRISSAKDVDLIEMKHRKIVDAAANLFFEKGYHPTSIRAIAKQCGMSMGQLYHYISSKDDVLYLVHKHIQEDWYMELRRTGIEKIEPPVERLAIALERTLEFSSRNKKLIQFFYRESRYLNKKHLKFVMERESNQVIGFWRNILEEVNKQKPIEVDLNFAACLITFLVSFMPLRGWTLKDQPKKENHNSLMADFILGGLGLIR